MTAHCTHEHEVVAAVTGRRWGAADEVLKQHAASCEICGEVVTIATLLSADQDLTRPDVRVPAAGQVWWRSAVRARLEAAQTAARPLTWVHGIAGACAVGLVIAVIGMAWPSMLDIASWLASHARQVSPNAADVVAVVGAMMQKSLPLAFVAAACLLLAPVALYFALSDE